MVQLFLGNRSGVVLLLPLLIGGYVSLNWMFPHHLPEANAAFGFWDSLLDQDHLVSVIGAPLLALLNSIVVNEVFNRNGFQEKNIFLPALIFVVVQSYFHSFYFLTGQGIATSFIILSLQQIFKLDQNSDGRRHVFNASFLMGVAITFYPFLLISVPFLFLMIWVVRPFVLRESALATIGVAFPLIYAGVYDWINNITFDLPEFSSASGAWLLPDLYVVGGGMSLIALAGLGPLLQKMQQSSIRLKKLFRISILLIFVIALLTGVELLVNRKIESVAIGIVPLIYLTSYAFGTKKPKPFAAGIFYLVFAFSVGKFFFPFHF